MAPSDAIIRDFENSFSIKIQDVQLHEVRALHTKMLSLRDAARRECHPDHLCNQVQQNFKVKDKYEKVIIKIIAKERKRKREAKKKCNNKNSACNHNEVRK